MQFSQVDAFRGGDGMIRVIGHRGARGILPENTMTGFEFALTTGINLLEFDVVLTRDNVPVITHNHRLHAPTFRGPDGLFLVGEEPKVSSLTLDEIGRFDIGRLDGRTDYGRRFPDQAQMDGVHVPRLRDLLRLVSQPRFSNAHLMLELKSDPDFAADTERRGDLVNIVVEEVQGAGLTGRTILHSFDWTLLSECQRRAPDMPASYLTRLPENADDAGEDSARNVSPDFQGREHQVPDMVKEAGGALWCPYYEDVTAKGIARARELGLCVAVWTVNEAADIDRMINLGVDAIVSDYPGRVQRRLSDRGLRWLGH